MKVKRIQPRPQVRRVRFVTAAPVPAPKPAAKPAPKVPRRRFLPFAGVGVLVMAVASVALVGFTHRKPAPSFEADLVNIPYQIYSMDASKGDVIQGQEGSIFAFPENAFLDEMGNTVTGQVSVRIKEARSMKDILKGNLATLTGGKELATDGMYYIDASVNGKALRLNPEVGVYAYFPTQKKDGAMGLYAGEADGKGLNWNLLQQREKSIPMCDRDEESRKMCKRCEKLAKMSKKIKVGSAPTKPSQFYEDRYYWQNGKLMFASSGSSRPLFTEDELKDCEQYLKASEKGQELLAKVDKIREEQKANSGAFYTYQLNNFGWYNIDKLVNDELISFTGKVKDANGDMVQTGEVHLISTDPARKIHTVAKVEGGSFTHRFAKDAEFHIFVVSGSVGGTASFTVSKDGQDVGDIKVEKLDMAVVDKMMNKVM